MRVAERATDLKVPTTMREMAQVNVVCVHVLVALHILAKGRMAISPVKAAISLVRASIAKIAPTNPPQGEAIARVILLRVREKEVIVLATIAKVATRLVKVATSSAKVATSSAKDISPVPVTIREKAISHAKEVTSSVPDIIVRVGAISLVKAASIVVLVRLAIILMPNTA